jgi:di/tricarboxylate transporter
VLDSITAMGMDQWLLIAIIAVSTSLYVTNWIPTEVTAALTIVVLTVTGILQPGQALSGFSSTATVTVAAMFVLSAGLMRTGALEAVTVYLGRYSRGSLRRLLVLLALVEVPTSAFMNNTPVVVMMIPVVLSLARRYNLRASKLLLPVSYFAVLGGTVTLIGTSTNILVSDLYRQAGGPGFGLFEFTQLGIIYAVVGSTFLVLVGHRLLPSRSPLASLFERPPSAYVTEIVVTPESRLVGRPASEVFSQIALREHVPPPQLGLRRRRLGKPRTHLGNGADLTEKLMLLEIIRDELGYQAESLTRLTFAVGDVLLIAGTPKDIHLFQQTQRAQIATVVEDQERAPVDRLDEQVVEAVVLPQSPLVNRRVGELMLTSRFDVKIMGLQHGDRQKVTGLRHQRLESGDVLLLRGESGDLRTAAETCRLLLVEGVESSLVRKAKNRTALVIMALVIILATVTELPIVVLALAGAAFMVITRCLRIDEAVGSLEASSLMLLVGTIPIGVAMETTGLVDTVVNGLIAFVGTTHPTLLLAAFYILTALLTELLSNNAVAVLLTPVAMSLAATLGVSETPFLVAVLFGASASFMTPFGYQTNAIVMGPGGYRFGDYVRIGLPLQVVMCAVAIVFIPYFWPL